MVFPMLFILVLWIIAIWHEVLGVELHKLGVYPRNLSGLHGVLTIPFVHGDFKHLLSNSIPLLVMGSGIIYFYRNLSFKVFAIVWIASGICIWIAGRPSYHIGASGIVYGLASFLFFSGAIRRDPRLAAISLVIVFLYGGMVWGIFPLWPNISWEGHLFGGISGLACAIAFRHQGPQRPVYSWELDEDEDYPDDPMGEANADPENSNQSTTLGGEVKYTSTSK
jgi:membrane associated rhomboid family serine protease